MCRMYRAIRWFAGLAVVTALGVIAWQCADIYQTGVRMNAASGVPIYTMEDVLARLKHISIPLFICLAIILTSIIFQICCHPQGNASQVSTSSYQLRMLKERLSVLPEQAYREESFRKHLCFFSGLLIALLCIPPLAYLLNVNHFSSWDLEYVLCPMLRSIMPWLLLCFATAFFASILVKRSLAREVQLLANAPQNKVITESCTPPNTCVTLCRLLLYLIAIICVVIGVFNGGLYDVLVKAINICTECIGLG